MIINSISYLCNTLIGLKLLINKLLPKTKKIMIAGCGNSTLSEEMYKDGYTNITSIDYSSVVIENMNKR